MTINRRRVLMGALAAPAVIANARLGSAAAAVTLKISHQFPGGTIDEGDFRGTGARYGFGRGGAGSDCDSGRGGGDSGHRGQRYHHGKRRRR